MADEEHHDDQLRQVWLAMRDEDPPERGLDALMAAARSQAKIMAQPTLWQRFAAAMRRPPVLALATVIVLLGGALILTHHEPALEKAPSGPPPQADTAAPMEIGGGVRTKVEPPPPPPPAVLEHDKQENRPQHHVSRPETAGKTAPSLDDGFVDERAKMKADVGAPKSANEVLVDQLDAQVRSAMTRGDCETAKSIATRIARQDQGYYRDHVATEISTCTSGPAAADQAH